MPKQVDTSRFIILPLDSTLHHTWATAIFAHSNFFCGPVLPVLHPTVTPSLFRAGFALNKRHVAHSIGSSFSFGVFDTQYPYRTASARAQGGAFLWDEEEPINDGDELLRRMDFPLVSICLSYDGILAFPGDIYSRGGEGVLPIIVDMYEYAAGADPRPVEETVPSRAGQMMFRNSTSTRKDYEGRGLMRYLSDFVMRNAQRRGFERIQFEIMNSGVQHVWMNPPEGEGFRSQLVYEFVIGELEKMDEEGRVVKPYAKVRQTFSRVVVDLKAAGV